MRGRIESLAMHYQVDMYGQVSLDVLPQQWSLLNPQHSLDGSAGLLDPLPS